MTPYPYHRLRALFHPGDSDAAGVVIGDGAEYAAVAVRGVGGPPNP